MEPISGTETPAPTVPAANPAVETNGIPGKLRLKAGQVLSPAEIARRAKFRLKYYKAKDKEVGTNNELPFPGPAENTASPPPVSVPSVGRWDSTIIKRFLGSILPALENWSIARLVAKAAKLGNPALTREVEKDAAWPTACKEIILNSGPEVIADALNQAGIDPKYFPLATLIGAVGGIVVGQGLLAAKLDRMIAEQEQRKEETRMTATGEMAG
jgi:hypothetical protein